MIDLFEKCYKPGIADEARALGIYPYFHALESKQDVTVIMEGKRRIMLGSNNYLGLTTNETVIRAGVEAYERVGSGCSGSRFLNGTLELHLELEKELAAFLRKDEVVTFSTGFQSNLGFIRPRTPIIRSSSSQKVSTPSVTEMTRTCCCLK